METATKITGSASAILLIASIVMANSLIGQDNVYACQSSNIAMICDSLSKANLEGIQSRCYYTNEKNISTYKSCTSGWVKFENKEVNIISNNSVDFSDYICSNKTFMKECKNSKGDLIIRIKYE